MYIVSLIVVTITYHYKHHCQVTNILGLAPPPSQQQHAVPTRGSVLRSWKKTFCVYKTKCVFYVNVCRERHGTEGSNVSGASLEHSSSVEVGQLNYITAGAVPTFGNIKSDLVWQKRTSFVFVLSFVISKFGWEGKKCIWRGSSVFVSRFCPRWRTRQSLNLTSTPASSDQCGVSQQDLWYICRCTNIQSK